jgi:hypothetical protein
VKPVFFQRYQEWVARKGFRHGVLAAYALVVVLFLASAVQFYIPGKGFSYLISFGATMENTRISKIRRLDHHIERSSAGYDSQFYVQIAMDPSLQNRELRQGVDNLAYRGRRILFATTAYVLGLGHPEWILQAYAVQNIIAWLLLAAVLLHWFPPRDWDRFLRWCGVLLSVGMCLSVRNALFDGPSLLVVAFGLYLLDQGRPRASTAVLALGGLGKETNLLAAAALLPRLDEGWPAWRRAVGRGVLAALPLLLWLVYIHLRVGPAIDAGRRNFDLPAAAYFRHWDEILQAWPNVSWTEPNAFWSLLALVGLTVQCLYLLLRPEWKQPWWRVGVSYALLMVVLGDAVWEGFPGAAARVLLPMLLAFNILVPAGRGWLLVLLLGNISLLNAPSVLQAPLDEGMIRGPSSLVFNRQGDMAGLRFSDGWYMAEGAGTDTWTWAHGSAGLEIDNPQAKPVEFRLRFGLTTAGARTIRVVLNGTEIWRTRISGRDGVSASLTALPLQPGRNQLEFLTDEPPERVGTDPRPLTFSLRNFRIDLQHLLTGPAPR